MAAKLHTSPPVMSPRYSREPSMLSVRCGRGGRWRDRTPATATAHPHPTPPDRRRTAGSAPTRVPPPTRVLLALAPVLVSRARASGDRAGEPEAGALGALVRGARAGRAGVDGDGEHLAGQLPGLLG